MKRRALTLPKGSAERSDATAVHSGSSRRSRHRVFITSLTLVVVILYVVLRIAATHSDEVLTDAAWLTPAENGLKWQKAMLLQSAQNTPSSRSLALQQVLFISCNRHDRSQAYWANIAVAAQCEMLSRGDRAAAAPCRRLYSGLTPLNRAGGVLTEEVQWTPEAAPLASSAEVPLGACGSVYDTPAAAQHRTSLLRTANQSAAKPQVYLRFPVAPLTAEPAPLDAVLWLGDAIYADKRADGQDGQSLLFHHQNSLAEVGGFWRIQRDAPEYNAFVTSCVAPAAAVSEATLSNKPAAHDVTNTASTRVSVDQAELVVPQPPTGAEPRLRHNVWGTWDDHDMGKNDGGREYPYRNVTQRFFLDFLRAPATDPRWTREGVYEAYTLPFHAVVDNEKGWGASLEALLRQLYEHAICIVLLDVRSFRDPPNATYAGDMLGDAQWDWLEAQLQRFTTPTRDGREPCALTLIGSGIQFMLDEKPAENWAAFPGSRDRLLGLLRLYKAERVAFLTGDVHMGELGGDFTSLAITQVLGYPLLEATSSGLTHSANMFMLPTILPRFFRTPRRLSLYVEKNFGAVRLSVDLLRLAALHQYLNGTAELFANSSLPQTPEQRQAVRDGVQQALNVTFTIFSLPQHGQPVGRLNFPLSMLTYAHGPTYLDATVDPVYGSLHIQNAATGAASAPPTSATATPTSTTTFKLRNGTVVSVPCYPVTSPLPFVTWYTRLAQRYIFTRSSVSESLKWCLIFQITVELLCVGLLLGWVCRRLQLRRRQRQQWQAHPTSPLLSRNAELTGEPPVLVQPRWWNRLLRHFQKEKKG
ncbi:hypothetical protein N2W54_003077 [Lotmaria passim]